MASPTTAASATPPMIAKVNIGDVDEADDVCAGVWWWFKSSVVVVAFGDVCVVGILVVVDLIVTNADDDDVEVTTLDATHWQIFWTNVGMAFDVVGQQTLKPPLLIDELMQVVDDDDDDDDVQSFFSTNDVVQVDNSVQTWLFKLES